MGQEIIDQEEIDQEAIDGILRVLIRAFFIGTGLFLVQELAQVRVISGDFLVNILGTGIISILFSIIIQKYKH